MMKRHGSMAERRPFWQELAFLVVPIVVGETCLAVRDHLRRQAKRARAAPSSRPAAALDAP